VNAQPPDMTAPPSWGRTLRDGSRLAQIVGVLVRHGLDRLLPDTGRLSPLRVLTRLWPGSWFSPDRRAPLGVRIRCALEELGPIFIKFGQALSTRKDLLPPEVALELAKLQDRVPPFPGDQAQALVERALGKPVGELFASFDTTPMASASIAQVHAATLPDGRAVVVKVVRPGIERLIRRDVALLKTLAGLAQRHWTEGPRLRPLEVVEEFERTLFEELDLSQEAAAASEIRRNFHGSALVYVPEVYWDLTRQNVMVQERIYGVPISDVAQLRAAGTDMAKLAARGVEIFFTQVFVHNFFHADMHPGNVFVDITNPAEPRYMAVDFGIVGSLTPEDQRYLAENFHAFFNRDYRRVAELHVESGWVPPQTRIEPFESAIRAVCEPIFQKPIKDISFGYFLMRLFQTARRFDMQVQPQLVLLQKTVLAIEGLGRELYPELDLWATAKPFIARWMAERSGPRGFVNALRRKLPAVLETLPELPELAHRALAASAENRAAFARQAEELSALRRELKQGQKKTGRLLAGAVLLLLAAWLAPPALDAAWTPWLAAGLATVAAWLWWRAG